jgi:hypothetical protein
LETAFETGQKRKSFFLLEPVSEKRQSHWENYDTIEFIPFEKINIEGIEIPKNIRVRYLNILTAMINRDPNLRILNLLSPPGIIELSIVERKIEDEQLQEAISLEERSAENVSKTPPSTEAKRKKGWKYLFVIILALGMGLILLDNPTSYIKYIDKFGKRSQSLTDNQFLAESLIDSIKSQSDVIIEALHKIYEADAHSDLISLNIQDSNADYGIASADSSFVTSIIIGNIISFKIIDIECCGGFLSSVSTVLSEHQPDASYGESMITPLDFESYLNSELSTFGYTKPDQEESTQYFYDPYILQMDNLNDLKSFLESEKYLGTNLVVRKITIDRNLESDSIEVLVYLMLLATNK